MMPLPKAGAAYWVLTLFLGIFLFFGLYRKDFAVDHVGLRKKHGYDFPDFNRIHHRRTLEEQEISLDTNDRIIIVGDIHGMNDSIHHLLKSLSYNPHNDFLIFAGDLLAKSTQAGSLSFLDFLTQNQYIDEDDSKAERIFAVRGNHDQLIVQWRTWREWFENLHIPLPSSDADTNSTVLSNPDLKPKDRPVSTGREFLHFIEAKWAIEKARRESDAEEWVEVTRKRAKGTWREEWWKRIPLPGKGKHEQEWRMFGDHYWLAREMSEEHAKYLTSLPLILHIPSLHFFVVHAGLLPYDTRLPPDDPSQPLAHLPTDLRSNSPSRYMRIMPQTLLWPSEDTLNKVQPPKVDEETLRQLQETSLITDIPQNRKWFNVLNMRSVRKKGKPTRDGDRGKPWSNFWNDQMSRCEGFDLSKQIAGANYATKKKDDYSLNCRPSTVVYGHSASRGLDLKRWTKGLDTGCLYGRKLTALILTKARHKVEDRIGDGDGDVDDFSGDKGTKGDLIPFGEKDNGIEASVHSIRCHAPDLSSEG